MKRFWRSPLFLMLVLGLLSAAPAQKAEEWTRLGNDAFDKGDYEGAVRCYTQAEEHITEPGLVSLNKGAALYRLGKFADAEAHYSRCLEDAAGERRARALFDLGNAVLQQGRDRDACMIERAIGYYEDCLRQEAVDSELGADVRFNLELARVLLRKAQAAKKANDSQNPKEDGSQPDERPDSNRGTGMDFEPGAGGQTGRTRAVKRKPGEGQQTPGTSSQDPPPGKGNLPPILDQDEMTPLSPEDTARYLEEVATRVLRERRENRKRGPVPISRHVMDW